MEILFFILGIIWASVLSPVFSALLDWFYAYIELKKARIGAKIYVENQTVEREELAKQERPPAIGFQVAPEIDYEALEEDE